MLVEIDLLDYLAYQMGLSGLKGYTALRCVRLLKFNRLSVQL